MICEPHVGHVPSVPPCDSVASNRDEQYTQLNPYLRPEFPTRGTLIGRAAAAPPCPVDRSPSPPPAITYSPRSSSDFSTIAGTRNVPKHVGHFTNDPTCASPADNGALQLGHSNVSTPPRYTPPDSQTPPLTPPTLHAHKLSPATQSPSRPSITLKVHTLP